MAHLINIDSYNSNFRIGYDDRRARHYYPRMDFRGAAEFVNNNAGDSDRIIITAVVFAQYLKKPNFVYLDKGDRRYSGQACLNDPIERWTNLPLLESIAELSAKINADGLPTSWIIIDQQTSKTQRWVSFLQQNSGNKEVYKSPDGRATVYVFHSDLLEIR